MYEGNEAIVGVNIHLEIVPQMEKWQSKRPVQRPCNRDRTRRNRHFAGDRTEAMVGRSCPNSLDYRLYTAA